MEFSRRRLLGVGAAAAIGGGTLGLTGQAAETPTSNALVAGSLLNIAQDVSAGSVEAHGSVAVRRLILEGARDPDAVAVADPRLLAGLAERASLFATNALVIAYDPESPAASAIRANWASALAAPDVRFGRTDPETDPLGYRTVMALKLAERRGTADRTEVLSRSVLLPETGLLRAVAGGKLDAAFAYRNMAIEHDLPFVELPSAIDFSDPAHAETYASVSLDLEAGTVRGSPIRYAASARTDRGDRWVGRLVGDRKRLREHGFTVPEDYPRSVAIDGESPGV